MTEYNIIVMISISHTVIGCNIIITMIKQIVNDNDEIRTVAIQTNTKYHNAPF